MKSFSEELAEQRWDDHRFYHQSRINQTLHFSSRADVGSSILLTGRDGPQTSHRYTWVKRPRRGAQ